VLPFVERIILSTEFNGLNRFLVNENSKSKFIAAAFIRDIFTPIRQLEV